MTRFDPNLIVTRLTVRRNEHIAYDERFHAGVNVIRGENSSGKSTILNCIYYGLGGDLADWSEHALLCTRVFVEVSMNGHPATLSREIAAEAGQPMEIYGGTYEASLVAPRDQWIRYPYRRSPSQESFSQALFRLLGIPEVANEVSGSLTMHQILRLLYSDQLSPVESLFRYDPRFDPAPIRDAVGRLLCGAYENRIYQNEILLREKSREFDSLNTQLRSLFSILGQTEHSLTLDWVQGERSNLIEEQRSNQGQIEEVERDIFTSSAADKLTLNAQNEAYAEVQRAQTELSQRRMERDRLSMSAADSALFIRSLKQKIESLTDAGIVAQHLGDVQFGFCPACLSPLPEVHDPATCHLCKAHLDGTRGKDRIVAIINEAAIQLKQSEQLQAAREQRISGLDGEISKLQERWVQASERLSSVQRLPSTDARERLRALHRRAGYLQRQLEDLANKERIIQLIDEVAARKEQLNTEISSLRSENERLVASQERRYSRAKTEIADRIRDLLRHDLRRQDSFENPQSINFDFSDNQITVDGHTYFSASSRVILKSSFFLGFLAAAAADPEFRHPRFVMIDTIEDKGMEPERSHNFQNQIMRISSEARSEHQIIYATAMISPDLDDEEFIIGRFSTRDEPTLKINS